MIEEMESFTYLGCIIDEYGGTDADVNRYYEQQPTKGENKPGFSWREN